MTPAKSITPVHDSTLFADICRTPFRAVTAPIVEPDGGRNITRHG
jgi:hypothetical protein